MYRFCAGYEYENGAVEGFIGYGFSPDAAERDCTRQMREKVGDAFVQGKGRVVRRAGFLTPAQFEQLKRDWLGILKAKRAAGHSVI